MGNLSLVIGDIIGIFLHLTQCRWIGRECKIDNQEQFAGGQWIQNAGHRLLLRSLNLRVGQSVVTYQGQGWV